MAQGMLPSKQFDYKSVDFSSFQGGSTEKGAHQVLLQPQVSNHFISYCVNIDV